MGIHMKKAPLNVSSGASVGCGACIEMSSVRVQPVRPAEAGMMMRPVCVLRAEHCCQAYRSGKGAVKFCGIDAFELALRLSLTPYGDPSGAIQIDSASPCRLPGRIVCPIAVNALNTVSGGPP